MNNIKITCGNIILRVQLRNTPTADKILQQLPIESVARIWGEEVYFELISTVDVSREHDAKDIVQPGEIAFWIEGNCIAIGFGPTPMSRGQEIRLAAKTNIWADSMDDVRQLAAVKEGDKVTVEVDS